MIKAGKILISLGAKNVLIKGGHLKSKKMYDILLNKKLSRYLKVKNTAQKTLTELDAHYLLQ
jgi:hydroxymethylpyrimidine/phosphomethylpyrimidine kinase